MKKAICAAFKYLTILALFLFLLFPVYWMLVTSLKTNVESYRIIPTLWPRSISFEGYETLFRDGKFLVYYQNNLIVSALAAVLICIISIMAGYALSRFHFRWNVILLATFSFSQMMPVISRLISLYSILRRLSLTDNRLGLVLAISATQVPFSVSLMASFFDGIPRDLEEAAWVDGCGRIKTLVKIIMPLAKPIVIYTILMAFMAPWGDYVFASYVAFGHQNGYNVAVGLYNWVNTNDFQNYFTRFCAGGVLVAVPITALFLALQKYYVEGVTGGAVKG